MGIKEKLMNIQAELKAPKGQYNNFGKYKYRSCEDILEAVKPLLNKNKVILTISDDIIMVGERFYIKVTATLSDIEGEDSISNTALAREELEKKGQDGSQITGTASSYARKYCLNGLFLIDDTKDADTNEYVKRTTQEEEKLDPPEGVPMCTKAQKDEINKMLKDGVCSKEKFADIQKKYQFTSSADLTKNKAQMVIEAMKGQ